MAGKIEDIRIKVFETLKLHADGYLCISSQKMSESCNGESVKRIKKVTHKK